MSLTQNTDRYRQNKKTRYERVQKAHIMLLLTSPIVVLCELQWSLPVKQKRAGWSRQHQYWWQTDPNGSYLSSKSVWSHPSCYFLKHRHLLSLGLKHSLNLFILVVTFTVYSSKTGEIWGELIRYNWGDQGITFSSNQNTKYSIEIIIWRFVVRLTLVWSLLLLLSDIRLKCTTHMYLEVRSSLLI